MKTFVLMTRLSPDVMAHLQDRGEIGAAWLEHVKRKCPEVKFIAHYGLLGSFDTMDIYEAPDEETAAKVSMISRANGAIVAESWTALPYKRIVELARDI